MLRRPPIAQYTATLFPYSPLFLSELRDPYLAGHSRRVAEFALAVGRQLGCSEEDLTTLELAANLSQIGKLAIRKELLTKPSRLTAEEVADRKSTRLNSSH